MFFASFFCIGSSKLKVHYSVYYHYESSTETIAVGIYGLMKYRVCHRCIKYSKTCLKQPLKIRQNKDLNDKL